MRGRSYLSILVAILLIVGTLNIVLPPARAYTDNVGISYVGASHEFPIRDEQGPEQIIVTAYNDGSDGGSTSRTFHVSIYYYTTTTPGTFINSTTFVLTTNPPLVTRNETSNAVAWNILTVPEGTYKFYAQITDVPVDDENAADNTRTSDVNASPRQRQLGIIEGHNVGMSNVQVTTFPPTVTSGTPVSVALSTYNNGYFAESFTVTSYYNRTGAPASFVQFNVTTITSMPAKTGTQSWSVIWNTTGLPEDTYTVSANASVVTSEIITYEQRDIAEVQVNLIQHDVATLDVIASPTGVTAGGIVQVNVTVENQGIFAETFNVRAKANGTQVATPQLVTALAAGANRTLSFNWNTLGWSNGFYVLNGSADFVTGEIIERGDNNYINLDMRRRVNIPAVHDVATTFVWINRTFAKPGDQVAIFATVENQGDADESFPVTPYYGNTQATPSQNAVIAKRAHTGESYKTQTLTFVWDTTGVPLGTYTIKVIASTVAGETQTADNTYTDGRVVFTKLYMDPARTVGEVTSMYQSRPTANTVTTMTVTNPLNAYDGNNATFAQFSSDTSGTWDLTGFSVPGLTTNVAQVDIKIRYSALSVLTDVLRVTQTVSPSATSYMLRDWSSQTVQAGNITYNARPEPNNGIWSWTDVQNINVKYEYDEQTALENPSNIRFYDTYVKISTATGTFYSRPTTHDLVGMSLTAPITNAYDWGGASTFTSVSAFADGYFNVRNFNITAGTGDITSVDLIIKFSLGGVSDRYRIQNAVTPDIYRDLVATTYSETNVPLQYYVFSYFAEPNNGNWSWTDVSNIRIRFNPTRAGVADARQILVYEVWATVYDKPSVFKLNVAGVSSLTGWQAVVTWDPTVVDLTSGRNGSFLNVTLQSQYRFTAAINHTGGYAQLSNLIIGGGSRSGSGTLAILTFKMIKPGKSNIALSQTALIPLVGDPMDHFTEDGKINTLPLAGDLNGDGKVDYLDIAIFNAAYGSKPGYPNWNAACDFNADNIVNAKDLQYLGINYW